MFEILTQILLLLIYVVAGYYIGEYHTNKKWVPRFRNLNNQLNELLQESSKYYKQLRKAEDTLAQTEAELKVCKAVSTALQEEISFTDDTTDNKIIEEFVEEIND